MPSGLAHRNDFRSKPPRLIKVIQGGALKISSSRISKTGSQTSTSPFANEDGKLNLNFVTRLNVPKNVNKPSSHYESQRREVKVQLCHPPIHVDMTILIPLTCSLCHEQKHACFVNSFSCFIYSAKLFGNAYQ